MWRRKTLPATIRFAFPLQPPARSSRVCCLLSPPSQDAGRSGLSVGREWWELWCWACVSVCVSACVCCLRRLLSPKKKRKKKIYPPSLSSQFLPVTLTVSRSSEERGVKVRGGGRVVGRWGRKEGRRRWRSIECEAKKRSLKVDDVLFCRGL